MSVMCYHVKTFPFFPSLLTFFYPPSFSFLPSLLFSFKLLLKHWVSFSLQLSPEEGYVSSKEDSFLHPPHSCEEEGLADRAVFRADLALVSGHNISSLLSEISCLIFAFQNILKSYCILFVHNVLEKPDIFISILVVLIVQNRKKNHNTCETICWFREEIQLAMHSDN